MECVKSDLRSLVNVHKKGQEVPNCRIAALSRLSLEISLHLKEKLASLWNRELAPNTFATLFDLFTEIHVFSQLCALETR